MYDFLIVGAGLYGSVCARELTDKGYKVIVIDQRNHIGGNCFTELKENINVHTYGLHIFHTQDVKVWNYINRFADFNNYIHKIKVNYKDQLYSFPINLKTFHQLYGIQTKEAAQRYLESVKIKIDNPQNLEEYCLSVVGQDLYEKFIYGYSFKQWNRNPKELSVDIIKRIPIRFEDDDRYFNDTLQGIPIGGYTKIFEKLLEGIEVKLNTQWNFKYHYKLAKNIIFTGSIDRFKHDQYGELEYRSVYFKENILDIAEYQSHSCINFTEYRVPYTRIIEHKHFEKLNNHKTIITFEYPSECHDPSYPINDAKNNKIYFKYLNYNQRRYPNVFFGGRLGEFKYLDMDKTIRSALYFCNKIA
jgi:UDP-galactopyranose mutase